MAQARRPLSPHLQIYRPMYTMVLSISHRITGVLLSVGSILLVAWLWAIAMGGQQYSCVLALLRSGWVKLLLLGFLFSFFYHLCNGMRHLVWDLGVGMEKHQARASGWTVVIVSILLTAVAAVMALRVIGAQP